MQGRPVFFVTGTDTGTGKTRISCALLEKMRALGRSAAAVKPLAAGAEKTAEGLRNEDALALQECCTLPMTYEEINPVCLELEMAPHLAAEETGSLIELSELVVACRHIMEKRADLTLIEGAGGWLVPLNDSHTLADLPVSLDVPVILVVGVRLGCLNHALLTVAAIEESGARLAGWVANVIEPPMMGVEGNIRTLRQRIRAPLLGTVPWLEAGESAAAYIDVQAFNDLLDKWQTAS